MPKTNKPLTRNIPLSYEDIMISGGDASILAVTLAKPHIVWKIIVAILSGVILISGAVWDIRIWLAFLMIGILLAVLKMKDGTPYFSVQDESYALIGQNVNIFALDNNESVEVIGNGKGSYKRLLIQAFFVSQLPTEFVKHTKNLTRENSRYRIEQYLTYDGKHYELRQVASPTNRKPVPPIK